MLLPAATDLRLDAISADDHMRRLTVYLTSTQATSCCPRCNQPAVRVHSAYTRTLADLPWADMVISLQLQVRKWFCKQADCAQSIFTERLPAVARPWARRTLRLATAQRQIGFALGGAAGARLATELRMAIGIDALLDQIRRTPAPTVPHGPAIGIDDWAFRKGHTYGTIIVDLQTGHPIDLLPDRSAETLATWLRAHPDVEIISRDRAQVYADGATQGAPQAIQVADRWHILKNLGDAVLQTLQLHHAAVNRAVLEPSDAEFTVVEQQRAEGPHDQQAVAALVRPDVSPPQTHAERERAERATRRHARYSEIHRLKHERWTTAAIARHLRLDRKTVRTYLRTPDGPQPQQRRRRRGILDPYKTYILEQWAAGCYNAARLLREIQAQGFGGKRSTLRAFLKPLRQAQRVPAWARHGGPHMTSGTARLPTARTLTWSVLARPETLDDEQRAYLARVQAAHPELEQLIRLAQAIALLVRGRGADQLDAWLEQASRSTVRALRGFASGVQHDYNAVSAALSLPWSNDAAEGNVNRLKMLKRQMYGRAKMDLLKQRVLATSG